MTPVRSVPDSVQGPHVRGLQVPRAIRNLQRRRLLDLQRVTSCVRSYETFPLTLYPHQPFPPRVCAVRGNLTASGADYVALADGLAAPSCRSISG